MADLWLIAQKCGDAMVRAGIVTRTTEPLLRTVAAALAVVVLSVSQMRAAADFRVFGQPQVSRMKKLLSDLTASGFELPELGMQALVDWRAASARAGVVQTVPAAAPLRERCDNPKHPLLEPIPGALRDGFAIKGEAPVCVLDARMLAGARKLCEEMHGRGLLSLPLSEVKVRGVAAAYLVVKRGHSQVIAGRVCGLYQSNVSLMKRKVVELVALGYELPDIPFAMPAAGKAAAGAGALAADERRQPADGAAAAREREPPAKRARHCHELLDATVSQPAVVALMLELGEVLLRWRVVQRRSDAALRASVAAHAMLLGGMELERAAALFDRPPAQVASFVLKLEQMLAQGCALPDFEWAPFRDEAAPRAPAAAGGRIAAEDEDRARAGAPAQAVSSDSGASEDEMPEAETDAAAEILAITGAAHTADADCDAACAPTAAERRSASPPLPPLVEAVAWAGEVPPLVLATAVEHGAPPARPDQPPAILASSIVPAAVVRRAPSEALAATGERMPLPVQTAVAVAWAGEAPPLVHATTVELGAPPVCATSNALAATGERPPLPVQTAVAVAWSVDAAHAALPVRPPPSGAPLQRAAAVPGAATPSSSGPTVAASALRGSPQPGAEVVEDLD